MGHPQWKPKDEVSITKLTKLNIFFAQTMPPTQEPVSRRQRKSSQKEPSVISNSIDNPETIGDFTEHNS